MFLFRHLDAPARVEQPFDLNCIKRGAVREVNPEVETTASLSGINEQAAD